VSDRLLLDTHIVLWLDAGDPRLRPATRLLIDECWQSGGTVLLSAVSVWEIALLLDTERIQLDLPIEAWLARFTNRPGVESASLTQIAAARAYQLPHLEHRDPADRLLIATAIEQQASFVTYDERIATFVRRYGRRYGFSVNAGSAASP
jgi:PIN domain nuclease of toxin-antitoxin system